MVGEVVMMVEGCVVVEVVGVFREERMGDVGRVWGEG